MDKILSFTNFLIYNLNIEPESVFNFCIFIVFCVFLFKIYLKPPKSKYRRRHRKKPKTKIVINRDENKLVHEDHTEDYYESIWDEINKH